MNNNLEKLIASVFRTYLVWIDAWYFLTAIGLLLLPNTASLAQTTSPFANAHVIGWSFMVVTFCLFVSLLKPEWQNFRSFALMLLVVHSVVYIATGFAIALTATGDYRRPIGWIFILGIHILWIIAAYRDTNPLAVSPVIDGMKRVLRPIGSILGRLVLGRPGKGDGQ